MNQMQSAANAFVRGGQSAVNRMVSSAAPAQAPTSPVQVAAARPYQNRQSAVNSLVRGRSPSLGSGRVNYVLSRLYDQNRGFGQ